MRSIKTIALAFACALMLTLTLAPSAQAVKEREPCANRLCTKYKAGTKSCWTLHGRTKRARCFIRRAADHFHQSRSQAYAIAYRESRYNWKATNSSSGAAGLYQFMGSTWESTPYAKYSPYHPRWAALAAMWMWKHGKQSHWSTY